MKKFPTPSKTPSDQRRVWVTIAPVPEAMVPASGSFGPGVTRLGERRQLPRMSDVAVMVLKLR